MENYILLVLFLLSFTGLLASGDFIVKTYQKMTYTHINALYWSAYKK